MRFYTILLIGFFFKTTFSFSQSIKLPEAVTNTATISLQRNGQSVIYTFFGLDVTKKWSGVHSKVFKVDVGNRRSILIGNVPDSLGRLASSVSAIKNKAYLAGGYTVFKSGKEKSSKRLSFLILRLKHLRKEVPCR